MTVKLRPARLKKGQTVAGWEYDLHFCWPDGTHFRERKNSPVPSKSGSLKYAQAREASLLAGGKAAFEAARAPLIPADPVPTLAAFWPRFVRDHYLANRNKPSMTETAERTYRLHLDGPLGQKPLDQISTADIAALKGSLATYAPKTVNNILLVLSRCLRSAVDWEVIEKLPCKIEVRKAPESEMAFYEVHEYRRLLEAARKLGTEHTVLVLLAGSAGLRRGEIRALKWTDLDFERKTIKVARAFWNNAEHTPKSGKPRTVPMTPELHAALKAHKHLRGERVLCTESGAPVTDYIARGWMGAVMRRAGIGNPDENLGAIHVLRHTFCSHLAAAGVPVTAIQALAGHAELKTTMRYMHLAPGDRDAAMRALAGYYGGAEGRREEEEKTG